jgi:hypothetical protein
MHSFLQELGLYLWAVLAHWQSYVTGGIVTATFTVWERLKKQSIPKRMYVIVFMVSAAFVACFYAWHDEHRNTQTVITEKAVLSSSLGNCQSELNIATEKTNFFEKQANIGLTNFTVQQSTLNSCVVALGRSNSPEPLRITVKEAAFSPVGQSEHLGKSSPSALVVETNRTISPVHGTLTCNRPFALVDAEYAMGPHWTMTAAKKLTGPNKARLEIESPAWNPGTPLVFLVISAGDLSPCEFKMD